MGQLTRLFVISRIFFMGFLISGSAIAETSPIEPSSPVSMVTDAAPGDFVGQAIQAALAPLSSAFPPLLTSPRHQRVDVNRVVLDFYSHRGYRAAWTDDDDVVQLLKSLSNTEIDGLDPDDFRVAELVTARTSMQATAPPGNRPLLIFRPPRHLLRRCCSCAAARSTLRGWTSIGISIRWT
ncbi:murein L,D-transpeptidase YcbB/YkuD [Pseudomonas sp. Tn43]|nr:murein L,D-transpeptidase YcbB/YkuD [Pseudomonas sp. Tn43]